jgi:phosphatidylglycerol:prolipoprotein diacylglycerol transferase
MMMFINNINPVLFSIGPFSVRYYGIVYALGFILAYLFLRHNIRYKRLKLTYDQLDSYFLWLIIGSILMARLFEVFVYNLPYYINHLSETYQIWNGGMAFQGGLIGAIIVTVLFSKKYKINFYDIADPLMIPLSLTLIFGRIANYTNSELYGTITNPISTPWCVVFEKVDNYCRHPTQIYEAIKNVFIFITLAIYRHHHSKTGYKHYKKGTLFWIFVLLYGILRFLITFLRDEPLYWGLNVGQWVCLAMVIVASIFLWRIHAQDLNVAHSH